MTVSPRTAVSIVILVVPKTAGVLRCERVNTVLSRVFPTVVQPIFVHTWGVNTSATCQLRRKPAGSGTGMGCERGDFGVKRNNTLNNAFGKNSGQLRPETGEKTTRPEMEGVRLEIGKRKEKNDYLERSIKTCSLSAGRQRFVSNSSTVSCS